MTTPTKIQRNVAKPIKVVKDVETTMRMRVNRINLDSPTASDMEYINTKVIPRLIEPYQTRIVIIQQNEAGRRQVAHEVHRLLNSGKASSYVIPLKKVSTAMSKLKKDSALDPYILRNALEKLGTKKIEGLKEALGMEQPEKREREPEKPVVEETKPAECTGSMQTEEPVGDNVHEEIESINTKDYVRKQGSPITESDTKKELFKFSVKLGEDTAKLAHDWLEKNPGGKISATELHQALVNTLFDKHTDLTQSMTTEMKDVVLGTAFDYVKSVSTIQSDYLVGINERQIVEAQRQTYMMNGLLNTFNSNMTDSRIQLQQFMNNSANLLYEQMRNNNMALDKTYDLMMKMNSQQSFEHSMEMNRLSGIIDKIGDRAEKLQDDVVGLTKSMKEMTTEFVKVLNNSQKRNDEHTEKLVLEVVSKLIEKQGGDVDKKEKDESVPVSYANKVLETLSGLANRATDSAQFATGKAYEQTGNIGTSYFNMERDTRENLFKKASVDQTSHSANKTTSTGGVSLAEALNYFKQAQLMAQNLIRTKDTITVSDYLELAKLIGGINLNSVAKSQAMESGLDLDALEQVKKSFEEDIHLYDANSGEDEIKETTKDKIDVFTDQSTAVQDMIKETIKDHKVYVPHVNVNWDYGVPGAARQYYESEKSLQDLYEDVEYETRKEEIYNYIASTLWKYDKEGFKAFSEFMRKQNVILDTSGNPESRFNQTLK